MTPEGIDLGLGLATMNLRAGAFLIDLTVMLLVLGILYGIAEAVAVNAFRSGNRATFEVVVAVFLLIFFFVRNGYFILWEAGPRGSTPGKRAVGLRVIARSGERLTVDSVVARNLMREVEFFLPISFLLLPGQSGAKFGWYEAAAAVWLLLFLAFPLFNRDRLRVGDLLAGTWVISAPRRRLAYDLVGEVPAADQLFFTPAQLDVYGVYELQTLERVLREGDYGTIVQVADTIRRKIGFDAPGEDARFLHDYYAAVRAHMERGLLFGRRRRDKFDRAS